MIKELFKNQQALMIAGLISFLCLVILAIVSLFDSTQILDINRWIKPMKFFVSIAIFLWTTAIYLFYLKDYGKSKRLISWGIISVMSVEMLIIVMQAWRGTTSHFNTATLFDAMLFMTMGIAIVFSTMLAFYLLLLYFRGEIDLPKSVIWGMRLGLIVFLAASLEGGYMSGHLAHSVGVADGGAGLPIVNWSTTGGDLRVSHFFGMHAFQAVPVFAYTLEKYQIKSATVLTFIFAAVYFLIFTFLLIQALNGQPLFNGF